MMIYKITAAALIAALSISLSACAGMKTAGHKYLMRGQILEVQGDNIYLCVGSNDGAKVGQELTVYKFEKKYSHPKMNLSHFEREKAGTVRITSVVDEHMANAKIVNGEAKVNFVVELQP